MKLSWNWFTVNKLHGEKNNSFLEILVYIVYFLVSNDLVSFINSELYTGALYTQTDLVNVYVSVVWPVLEYACPVWHTNLTKYISDNIEMIQKRALKSIFPNKGYDDILCDLGMCTLHERRNVICEQYFKNMQGNSHKLHHLLPEERCIHYDMRRENKYPLTKNRTNRYGKSLIPWGLNNWQ